MRLVRYKNTQNEIGLGVIAENDKILDLKDAGLNFSSMEELIRGGDESLSKISDALTRLSADIALDSITLLAPIPAPGKILAIGMNYQKHVEESVRIGAKAPERQLWFNKQTSCINDPFGEIEPGVTEQLDYEVELGVVIGKPAKRVTPEQAYDHIFGYVIVNDVSARDWQFHSPTFTLGKSFDTHGPTGPWLTTADEIDDPQNLNLSCTVNGEVRQDSNTSHMIHKIRDQISYLSQGITLHPGDIIATGTPEGVGVGMQPKCFLKPGDLVRCEVEKLGAIENRVSSH